MKECLLVDNRAQFRGYIQVGGINGYSQPTPARADTAAGSTGPTGGLLLFGAITIVVLDHIYRKPTDN